MAERPRRAGHARWSGTTGCSTRNEPFAGELVADRLREAGVDIRLGADVEAVRRGEITTTDEGRLRGSEVTVVVGDEEIVADEILIAAGRTPRSADSASTPSVSPTAATSRPTTR